MSKLIKAGIIGFGYMGEIRLRNVNQNPHFDIVGICDPESGKLDQLGVPIYNDWQSLLESDIEAIFVCTPNFLIPQIAVAALKLGKHVFCEKPPGRNLDDIQKIRAAEQASPGCKLVFGFNHRHHPGILDAKSIIDSNALGAVLTLRGVYGKGGGYDYHKSWRNDLSIGGGGILLDQGIHMLDLFRLFVGDFTEVVGMRCITNFDIPAEDNSMLIMRTSTGQMAQLHSSATSWKHTFGIEIGCEMGYANISGLLSKTGSYGRETLVIGRRPKEGERGAAVGNPREETIYYDTDTSWDTEVAHFSDCILADKPVEMGTSYDALKVMEIIDEVYKQPLMNRKQGFK